MQGLLPSAMMMYLWDGWMLPKFFFQPPLPHTQKYKPKKISPSRSSIVAQLGGVLELPSGSRGFLADILLAVAPKTGERRQDWKE
jgi:hypothetical protein